ncbi:MltA-interacting MipA family protein [Aureimonas sp. SA4125]|uniref:MipA/OmpV family protein n=1 Tax=Aureimonas sp. SA4125 TaxID=2826993 RepID=UPI001CC4634A|nr:MipA/OmpV family protein [Aureimonas sp. SA4125]BDA86942.1 MltA-interacting MipA family protein [Aureimonas sp. SA4125]
MSRSFALTLAASLLAVAAAAPTAGAADVAVYDEAPVVAAASNTDIVIELGLGGRISPEYEGSKDYEVSPFPIISLGYLNIPGVLEIGSLSPQGGGLSIGPSFGYVGERESRDYDELTGLSDVDATYEAGIKVGYEWQYAEVYGAARYAFGGGEGFVGEVGANAIARPMQELELKAGPFASFASEDYTEAYFGVSAADSISSGLAAYDPDGGFKSVGVAASARYEFRPDWFLNADASYSRFVGDAEDSPIVAVGDDNQYTFGLGLSKRFTLDLF